MLKRIKAAIILFLGLWVLLCFLVMPTGDSIARNAPESWELPWSEFEDFVEDKYGHIYVFLRYYRRVQRYDRKGDFIASYFFGTKDGKLATCSKGFIYCYCRISNSIEIYNKDWELFNFVSAKDSVNKDWYLKRAWLLKTTSYPVYAPDKSYETVPNRVITPGEMLFSNLQKNRREYFSCADGTKLVRRGNKIVRYGGHGQVLHVYKTPWYLWWIKWPFPAVFVGYLIPLGIGISFTLYDKLRVKLENDGIERSE